MISLGSNCAHNSIPYKFQTVALHTSDISLSITTLSIDSVSLYVLVDLRHQRLIGLGRNEGNID
jgi:hypothetical protein